MVEMRIIQPDSPDEGQVGRNLVFTPSSGGPVNMPRELEASGVDGSPRGPFGDEFVGVSQQRAQVWSYTVHGPTKVAGAGTVDSSPWIFTPSRGNFDPSASRRILKAKFVFRVVLGAAIFCIVAIVLLATLSILGVLHWFVWLPGIVGCFGALGGNIIQLSKLDEAIKSHGG